MTTKNKKVSVTKTEVKKKEVKKVKTPKVCATPEIIEEAKARLISFSVTATIPTMMYGNIIPTINVEAPSLKEAKEFAMPMIEELYQTYVGPAQDGKMPKFINKANVTAEEKKVEVPKATAPTVTPGASTNTPEVPKATVTPGTGATITTPGVDQNVKEKSSVFITAEKAINACIGIPASNKIEEQIHASTKLTAEEKPVLLTLILKKRATLS